MEISYLTMVALPSALLKMVGLVPPLLSLAHLPVVMASCAELKLAMMETKFPVTDARPLVDLKRDGSALLLVRNVSTLTSAPFGTVLILSMVANTLLLALTPVILSLLALPSTPVFVLVLLVSIWMVPTKPRSPDLSL